MVLDRTYPYFGSQIVYKSQLPQNLGKPHRSSQIFPQKLPQSQHLSEFQIRHKSPLRSLFMSQRPQKKVSLVFQIIKSSVATSIKSIQKLLSLRKDPFLFFKPISSWAIVVLQLTGLWNRSIKFSQFFLLGNTASMHYLDSLLKCPCTRNYEYHSKLRFLVGDLFLSTLPTSHSFIITEN